MDEKVLTVPEVADYLRVHPSTIYRVLKQGGIPAFKVSGEWRFNIESIDQWRLGSESRSDRNSRSKPVRNGRASAARAGGVNGASSVRRKNF
jgi:excisionase family DNA binding protein